MTTPSRRAAANLAARRRTRESLAMLQQAYGCAGSEEARHLKRIVRASQEFARRWAAWATTPEQMPDEETVEAAGGVLEALGIEIRE